MNLYEKHVLDELDKWQKEILKNTGIFENISREIQNKTQNLIPEKVQNAITLAIEKIVKTIMFGSNILTIKDDTSDLSLGERDFLVSEKFAGYKKAAVTSGIGIGAGGIIVGLADLPVLLSIKVKFLFDSAKLYGFDVEDQNERMYMLNIFQMAFSSKKHRIEVFRNIEYWDSIVDHVPLDWEKFQVEYRDYIDIAKMLQLLPVVGSIAGGAANNKLMNRLKVNIMNCYRMRILGDKWVKRGN